MAVSFKPPEFEFAERTVRETHFRDGTAVAEGDRHSATECRSYRERFPDDFMFRLTARELKNLMSQFATSSSRWGGRRKLPLVFTEHGAVMAASVLNSPTAVAASIEVVRAFVRLRRILASHADLARKLDELEKKVGSHDQKFQMVFEAIRQLMAPPAPAVKRRRIGFGATTEDNTVARLARSK